MDGVGRRTIKGMVGVLDGDLEEGTDDERSVRAYIKDICGDGWREGWDGEVVPWTCFACGGEEEVNLIESAMECGKEEFEKALNGEWKTTWTE